MKEFILCAAIHYKNGGNYSEINGFYPQPEGIESGFIICGRRHSDCYNLLRIAGYGILTEHECGREQQGFLTSTNRFVNRSEAFRIAKQNNQIYHTLHQDDEEGILISEDLY